VQLIDGLDNLCTTPNGHSLLLLLQWESFHREQLVEEPTLSQSVVAVHSRAVNAHARRGRSHGIRRALDQACHFTPLMHSPESSTAGTSPPERTVLRHRITLRSDDSCCHLSLPSSPEIGPSQQPGQLSLFKTLQSYASPARARMPITLHRTDPRFSSWIRST
jgi:hypothetical protein